MPKSLSDFIIYPMCGLAIGWAAVLSLKLRNMTMDANTVKPNILSEAEIKKNNIDVEAHQALAIPQTPQACFDRMKMVSDRIKSGAKTFLMQEYLYLAFFCTLFGVLVYFTAETSSLPFTTVAFLIGAATSMLCGYLGMLIAVDTNWRVTYACNTDIDSGFHIAF